MNKLQTTLLLVLFAMSSMNLFADEFDDEIFLFDTTYDLTIKDEFDDEIFPFDTTYDLTAKGLIICISFNTTHEAGKGAISKNHELAFKAALLRYAGAKGEYLKSCKIPKCFWWRK